MTDQQCIAIIAAIFTAADTVVTWLQPDITRQYDGTPFERHTFADCIRDAAALMSEARKLTGGR